MPGSSPVNVCPYQYPDFQKDENKKVVKELREAGLIRHNSSPYSSQVLLFCKKNCAWRMCVDYRALNKIIIKDRFPIPMVEELLDESQGATKFAKLDLHHQIRVQEANMNFWACHSAFLMLLLRSKV